KLSATGPLGPYLCKFPSNPFVSLDTAGVECGTKDNPPCAGGGWYFNTRTGKLSANDLSHRGL
ncbi:hypothetical protein LCGC14_2654750, partial [marine sediment metagenome]